MAGTGTRLLRLGVHRPSRLVGNLEIAARIDSTDDWIRRRSGIVTRRFAADDESVEGMAADAATKAPAEAGVDASDIDAMALATMSQTGPTVVGAARVASWIGARSAAAFDIGAGCAGFTHALALTDGLIRAGTARHVVGRRRTSGSSRRWRRSSPCPDTSIHPG